jgi:large subunit ribosomal protein L27
MAKAGGKVSQKPPRCGKRLGVKLFGGQKANPGNIILRQVGSNFHPGQGTKMGKDYTIFAIKEGVVNFQTLKGRKVVEVV